MQLKDCTPQFNSPSAAESCENIRWLSWVFRKICKRLLAAGTCPLARERWPGSHSSWHCPRLGVTGVQMIHNSLTMATCYKLWQRIYKTKHILLSCSWDLQGPVGPVTHGPQGPQGPMGQWAHWTIDPRSHEIMNGGTEHGLGPTDHGLGPTHHGSH